MNLKKKLILFFNNAERTTITKIIIYILSVITLSITFICYTISHQNNNVIEETIESVTSKPLQNDVEIIEEDDMWIDPQETTNPDVPNIEVEESETNESKTSYPSEDEYKIGYTTTSVNIRSGPSTDFDIIRTTYTGESIQYVKYNDEWSFVKESDAIAYIYSKYVSEESPDYHSIFIESNGFKSFMRYTAITDKSSRQYKIQHNYAYTGNYGIRQVDDRYCVALGSGVGAKVGTYVDLILKNGTIINCILSDTKDDAHTLSDNITTITNGCVSEFLIDYPYLKSAIKTMGDCSYAIEDWKSPVVEIRVFDINIFD